MYIPAQEMVEKCQDTYLLLPSRNNQLAVATKAPLLLGASVVNNAGRRNLSSLRLESKFCV